MADKFNDRTGHASRSLSGPLKALLPDDGVERVAACFLRSGRFVTAQLLAEGTFTVVSLQARAVIHAALHFGADQMVIAHNHPSGNVMPSHDDVRATARLRAIAESLGIELIDHLIFGPAHAFSMKTGRAAWIGAI